MSSILCGQRNAAVSSEAGPDALRSHLGQSIRLSFLGKTEGGLGQERERERQKSIGVPSRVRRRTSATSAWDRYASHCVEYRVDSHPHRTTQASWVQTLQLQKAHRFCTSARRHNLDQPYMQSLCIVRLALGRLVELDYCEICSSATKSVESIS